MPNYLLVFIWCFCLTSSIELLAQSCDISLKCSNDFQNIKRQLDEKYGKDIEFAWNYDSIIALQDMRLCLEHYKRTQIAVDSFLKYKELPPNYPSPFSNRIYIKKLKAEGRLDSVGILSTAHSDSIRVISRYRTKRETFKSMLEPNSIFGWQLKNFSKDLIPVLLTDYKTSYSSRKLLSFIMDRRHPMADSIITYERNDRLIRIRLGSQIEEKQIINRFEELAYDSFYSRDSIIEYTKLLLKFNSPKTIETFYKAIESDHLFAKPTKTYLANIILTGFCDSRYDNRTELRMYDSLHKNVFLAGADISMPCYFYRAMEIFFEKVYHKNINIKAKFGHLSLIQYENLDYYYQFSDVQKYWKR